MPAVDAPVFDIGMVPLKERYLYEITPYDERPKGYAEVAFKSVNLCSNYECTLELIEKGLLPTDKIAEIWQFYPNGKLIDEDVEKYTRKGVGSKVLDRIISDSLDNECKAIKAYTMRPWMKSFLKVRHSFTPCNHDGTVYYKLLEPARI